MVPAFAESKVTVPLLCVKTPLLVQDFATVKLAELEAESVVPEPIETEPFTSKIRSLVLLSKVKAVPVLVRAKSLATIIWPVPVPLVVMVFVPEVLVKVRL